MILTVTLNPSLDYIQVLPCLRPGTLNRSETEQIRPGGKGINVSLVLHALGAETKATGFAGGFTGRELSRLVEASGVENCFVPVDAVTRINVKLIHGEETEINASGPQITEENVCALEQIISALDKGDVLVLSGAVPSSLPKDIYYRLGKAGKEKGVPIAVDTSGEALIKTLPLQPFLIKPNQYELSELLHMPVTSPQEAKLAALRLCEMGARNVLCSMGKMGAVFVGEKHAPLFCRAPEGLLIHSVGAGDSMLAGFLAGFLQTGNKTEAFLESVAAGSATAYSPWLAEKELVQTLRESLSDVEYL